MEIGMLRSYISEDLDSSRSFASSRAFSASNLVYTVFTTGHWTFACWFGKIYFTFAIHAHIALLNWDNLMDPNTRIGVIHTYVFTYFIHALI